MTVQTAVAAQTSRIRLGQYANIITWWHPIRFAEQAAMLDVISNGRLECGVGRGYQPRENETFGRNYGATIQDQERNRAAYEEAYEIILKAWTQPSMSHHGENFSIPPSLYQVAPRPDDGAVQPAGLRPAARTGPQGRQAGPVFGRQSGASPRPPSSRRSASFRSRCRSRIPQLWMPLTSERSIRFAASHGMNGGFIAEPTWRLKMNVEHYYDEAEKTGWPDRLEPRQVRATAGMPSSTAA